MKNAFIDYLEKDLSSNSFKHYKKALENFENLIKEDKFFVGNISEEIRIHFRQEEYWKYDEMNNRISMYSKELKKRYPNIVISNILETSIDGLINLKNKISKKDSEKDSLLIGMNLKDGNGALSGVIGRMIEYKMEDKFYLERSKYNVKEKRNRIIYGAPGTGKSYLISQQAEQKFDDIEIEISINIEDTDYEEINYWSVGATWDSINKLDEFIENSYWENGHDNKYIEIVKKMKKGDFIAIKSSFTRKKDGKYISCTRIKALGIIISSDNRGKKIAVEWKIKEFKDYDNMSMRATVQSVSQNYLKIFDRLKERKVTQVIEKSYEKISRTERVTFYEGYAYGQFVGTYKPFPYESNGKKDITYEYIAGPFIKQLVRSIQNPRYDFLLIIEEINRAKADKVFGNIFQLLDRKKDGESEYPISISRELEEYLKTLFNEEEYIRIFYKGLYIPKNLYIWATMNNSDQGVFLLDTAFKRRWEFEYIGLDDNKDEFGDNNFKYNIKLEKSECIEWNDYRESLNKFLLKNGVNEDRLIAPFFIKPMDFINYKKDKNDCYIEENIYLNKLLMYIFDDVLKHKKSVREKLFNKSIVSFSNLISEYNLQKNIYSEEFKELLKIKKIEEVLENVGN